MRKIKLLIKIEDKLENISEFTNSVDKSIEKIVDATEKSVLNRLEKSSKFDFSKEKNEIKEQHLLKKIIKIDHSNEKYLYYEDKDINKNLHDLSSHINNLMSVEKRSIKLDKLKEVSKKIEELLKQEHKIIHQLETFLKSWEDKTEQLYDCLVKASYSADEIKEIIKELILTENKDLTTIRNNSRDLDRYITSIKTLLNFEKSITSIELKFNQKIKDTTIFLDASFFTVLAEKNKKGNIELADANMKNNMIVIPKCVYREIASASNKHGGRLVNKKNTREIIGKLKENNEVIVSYPLRLELNDISRTDMRKIWVPKDQGDTWNDFLRTADFRIIHYIRDQAKHNGKRYLILGRDKDYQNFESKKELGNGHYINIEHHINAA
ncbi:MAG: hypothetical protein ACQESC_03925 [Nanobdellota archaeon]